MTTEREFANRAFDLAEKTIAPMLAGQGPEVQGGTLVVLLGMFLASHHPAIREESLEIVLKSAWEYCSAHERSMGDPWKGARQ